jgi:hypothetical protein
MIKTGKLVDMVLWVALITAQMILLFYPLTVWIGYEPPSGPAMIGNVDELSRTANEIRSGRVSLPADVHASLLDEARQVRLALHKTALKARVFFERMSLLGGLCLLLQITLLFRFLRR